MHLPQQIPLRLVDLELPPQLLLGQLVLTMLRNLLREDLVLFLYLFFLRFHRFGMASMVLSDTRNAVLFLLGQTASSMLSVLAMFPLIPLISFNDALDMPDEGLILVPGRVEFLLDSFYLTFLSHLAFDVVEVLMLIEFEIASSVFDMLELLFMLVVVMLDALLEGAVVDHRTAVDIGVLHSYIYRERGRERGRERRRRMRRKDKNEEKGQEGGERTRRRRNQSDAKSLFEVVFFWYY